jgi:arylsulfatase A-like enzyme
MLLTQRTASGKTLIGVPRAFPVMNVLFVFADQMHAFALGCMGNADIDTPHLDRLAAQGTLFQNCYTCNAVCTPYRAALMTGRHSCQTGILNNQHKPIPPGERTVADGLNAGGLHTSYVGKWHIGDEGNIPVEPRFRGGFTDFIGYQCYNDYLRDIHFFDEEGCCHTRDGHRVEALTDVAIERLDRIKDRPFAMFVSYDAPHYPVQPGREFADRYWERKITLRPNCAPDVEGAMLGPGQAYPWHEGPAYLRRGNDVTTYIKWYYALITQMDEQIGRLLAKLEEWGLAENTLVVFTADHGDMQGSHGLLNKHVPFEESTRVPLIVRRPGAPAGLKRCMS